MNETQQTATIDVAVDLDEIFNLIYAESDWISAHNGSYYRLSHDNAPMLRLRVGEGYAQLQPRLQPYLLWANYNPNIEQRNLTLTLQFEHPQPHDDCPFFFLLTMPAIIRATAATSTAQMMIVAIFS